MRVTQGAIFLLEGLVTVVQKSSKMLSIYKHIFFALRYSVLRWRKKLCDEKDSRVRILLDYSLFPRILVFSSIFVQKKNKALQYNQRFLFLERIILQSVLERFSRSLIYSSVFVTQGIPSIPQNQDRMLFWLDTE